MRKVGFSSRKTKTVAALLAAAALAALPLSGCGGNQEVSAEANVQTLLKKGIRPNEMGQVMVLEYHRIEEKEGNYTRSVENFKKDLEMLYQKGYRLVTFNDLVNGKVNVPAGTTPVVLSFDDSTAGQFTYLKEGDKTVISPNCAVGMMNDFYGKHKDFGYTGLFNFLPELFDQPKYEKKKVEYLQENGFELGNHTESHPNLSKLDDAQVQKEIAGPVKLIKDIDPSVSIDVLCLPHGIAPKNSELMWNGSSDGTKYHNDWALLVGSNPFYPMYHYKNPGKLVPRVQVMEYDPEDGSGIEGSNYWLSYFDKHPELRYISDGDPKTICAPAYTESRLLPKQLPKNVTFVGY